MSSLLLCLCLALPSAAGAAEVRPGYRIVGTYQEASNELSVQFYIHDISASAGRFALGFDPAKLSLIGGDSLRGTVTGGASISITTEGYTASELISTTEGYVMFAWNPASSRVDATKGDYLIATVRFALPAGVTTADFDESTLTMHYVGGNQLGWDTGAWLRGAGLMDYQNAVEGIPDCQVRFEYPGSDTPASNAHSVELKLTDTTGKALPGTAVLGVKTLAADRNGICADALTDGSYFCRVTADGYEEKIVTVKVKGDTAQTIALRSSQQLVSGVAAELSIGFAEGDSAGHVTRDMAFLRDGPQNTKISWSVSSPLAVNEYGNVFRQKTDTPVTATATVSKDSYTAKASFDLVIAAKTAETPDGNTDGGAAGGKDTDRPPETPFTDLDSVSWAREQIIKLHSAGVINGTSSTTFSPGLSITRGDFMALLMRMMKPSGTPGTDFSDVPSTSYYHDEIALARGLGIAQGSGSNSFRPLEPITRQDMMTLTYRALLTTGHMAEQTWTGLERFRDAASIAPYALEPMKALVGTGYIAGDGGGRLNPVKDTSRAEAAVFLCRIYEALYET